VQSVVEIRYLDMAGAWQVMPAASYTVDSACEPARITPVFGQIWPIALPQIGAVSVIFDAGYGDAAAVPEGIKTWIKLRLGSLYVHREEVASMTRGRIDPLPFIDGLLDPYKVPSYEASMNPIGAGTLGRRIKIQRPSTVKDSLGAPSRTWIDVATVWADIQPLSGREAVIASRISAELSHQITVRYQSIFDNPQLVAQYRVLYRSRIFNIHSALNEDEKRVLVILLASEGLDDG
jgi:SPP1 family predicted phage head-tail adaptor